MAPIEFVSDGRVYEPPPGRSFGEFICVFGALINGPAAPPFGVSVVEFSAELTRPDGTRVLVDDAHVDYPLPDEAGEGPFVLLRGARAADVPAGTRIVSRGIRWETNR
jgi:hypothetical protein